MRERERGEWKEEIEEARLGGRLGVIYPWGPVGGCLVLGSAVQDWSDVWQLTDDEAAFQSPSRPPFTPSTCWFSLRFGFWRIHYKPRGKFELGITGLLAEIGTYVMRPVLRAILVAGLLHRPEIVGWYIKCSRCRSLFFSLLSSSHPGCYLRSIRIISSGLNLSELEKSEKSGKSLRRLFPF